jgi:hypothetical protein
MFNHTLAFVHPRHRIGSDHVAQPALWRAEVENQGNGQPLLFHLHVCLAGKYFSRGDYKKPQ